MCISSDIRTSPLPLDKSPLDISAKDIPPPPTNPQYQNIILMVSGVSGACPSHGGNAKGGLVLLVLGDVWGEYPIAIQIYSNKSYKLPNLFISLS